MKTSRFSPGQRSRYYYHFFVKKELRGDVELNRILSSLLLFRAPRGDPPRAPIDCDQGEGDRLQATERCE